MRRPLKATICNKAHPEYGTVSLPFPIQLEEYDENLKMLDALGIGGHIERDCFVAELSTAYPILKCLEGSRVNVDELDYLIKYLDSFTPDEVAAFQGVASEREVTDLPGLINLAFSCSQVVAVEDFRNLERVGIWLLLARNTSVDPPELDRDTAVKTAIDALSSGEGIVTPYGVIFENGMELQTVYDGRIFPEYSYEAPLVTVEIPVSAKHSTYSLFLPMAEGQLKRYLDRLGEPLTSVQPEQVFGALFEKLDLPSTPDRETVENLNRLCLAVKDFDEAEFSTLRSMAAPFETITSAQLTALAKGVQQLRNTPDETMIQTGGMTL